MSMEDTIVVDNELKKLIEKGVIRECQDSEVLFLSNIFLRPKRNGQFRIILNLKELNKGIEYKKLKMETLESIIRLIRPNNYMASLDLSGAYCSVPIAEEHQGYLCFPWVNNNCVKKTSSYTCLENG